MVLLGENSIDTLLTSLMVTSKLCPTSPTPAQRRNLWIPPLVSSPPRPPPWTSDRRTLDPPLAAHGLPRLHELLTHLVDVRPARQRASMWRESSLPTPCECVPPEPVRSYFSSEQSPGWRAPSLTNGGGPSPGTATPSCVRQPNARHADDHSYGALSVLRCYRSERVHGVPKVPGVARRLLTELPMPPWKGWRRSVTFG